MKFLEGVLYEWFCMVPHHGTPIITFTGNPGIIHRLVFLAGNNDKHEKVRIWNNGSIVEISGRNPVTSTEL